MVVAVGVSDTTIRGESRPESVEETLPADEGDDSFVSESISGHRTLAGTSGRASPGRGEEPRLLDRGESVGRYVVLGRVGAGGMGVVYAAYDPDLDRKVALKLLHGGPSGSSGTGGETRLIREAQAMAKLSHPNVIAVHDVGTYRGNVFVAMEFVDGPTLAAWHSQRRPWKEVLRMYLQAGRGLTAAHAVGLVHRDFKPANALIGSDGRVRVLDFGLARRAGQADSLRTDVELVTSASSLDTDLTRTGAVLGTPAYMAPEQHLGLEPGPAADQFSFCASLYEALYGQRPFEGETLANLSLAVLDGRVREPPRGHGVPPRLFRVLARGMSVAPENRFASMQALLDELADDPRARRLRMGAVVLGLGGVSTFGWLAMPGTTTQPCRGGHERVAAVWNEARRSEIEGAFEKTNVYFAQSTWDRVAQSLDARARAWVAMYEEACRATRVLGEQSEQLLDLRMQCLDRKLADLDALLGVLAQADRGTVGKAVDAVHGLSPVDACADVTALSARVPPPDDPAVRAHVDDARDRLRRARALGLAGSRNDALEQAEAVVAEARRIDWAPLLAEALELQGELLADRADAENAESVLEEAIWAGIAADDDAIAARAALELSFLLGYRHARFDDAERWQGLVGALVRKLPQEKALAVRARYARGAILFGRGRIDEAQEAFEQAHRLAEDTLEPSDPLRAMTSAALGNVAFTRGRVEEAEPYYREALELVVQARGEDHPTLADFYNNLAVALWDREDYEGARTEYARALSLYEKAHGREHPEVASTLSNIAVVYEDEQRWDEAEAHHREAVAILEKTLGPAHPDLAISYTGLGNVARGRGDDETALAHHRRALDIRLAALGEEHPEVAASLTAVGEMELRLGREKEAVARLEQALAIKEKALGADHRSTEHTRRMLDEARAALDRARSVRR